MDKPKLPAGHLYDPQDNTIMKMIGGCFLDIKLESTSLDPEQFSISTENTLDTNDLAAFKEK